MDKQIAANLFDHVAVTMDRFHAHVVCKPKVDLLGFADVSIEIPAIPGFALKLRNIEVKVLNGKARIDTPSERSKEKNPQTGKFDYFPVFFPKSAEMRAVITTRIFDTQEVAAAVAAAEQARTQAPATASLSGSNPFREGAPVTPLAPPVNAALNTQQATDETEVIAQRLRDAGFKEDDIQRAIAGQ